MEENIWLAQGQKHIVEQKSRLRNKMYGDYTITFQNKGFFLKRAAQMLHLKGPKHITKERMTQLISTVVELHNSSIIGFRSQ